MKDKLELTLKWLNTVIPNDKLLHSFYATWYYMIVQLFDKEFAFVSIIIIVFAKEVYDYFNKENHTADYMDFIATVALPVFIYYGT